MAGTGGLAGKTIMGGTIALGAHNCLEENPVIETY